MSIFTDYDPSVLADLKPAVARLCIPAYADEGTGFLVSHEELLTCAHVVKNVDPGDSVLCRFGNDNVERTATLVRRNAAADVAVLRLDQPMAGVRPLELAPAGQRFTSWVGYGFPAFTEGVGVPLVGSLIDPALSDRDGRAAIQVSSQMLVGDAVTLGGFSGTPILAGKRVVGMLYRVLGAKADWSATHFGLLYAVPPSVLAAYLCRPEVPAVRDLVRDDETRHSELIRLLDELRCAGNPTEVLETIERLRTRDLLRPATTLQAAEMLLDMGAAAEMLWLIKGIEDDERASQLSALAYSLRGEHQTASAMLSHLGSSGESGGIAAGVLKRRYLETKKRTWLQAAYAQYLATYMRTGQPYPGINAAALALWSGDVSQSRELAARVRACVVEKGEPSRDYWDWATLAEAHLLLGNFGDAISSYQRAARMNPAATRAIAAMRTNARIDLEHLGRPREELDEVLPVGAVAWITGHRVDAPGAPPRFPSANVPGVARKLKSIIERRQIQFGFGSAAGGADLLFMEALLDADGDATVYLPFPAQDFVAASVGPEWQPRFERVLARLPHSRQIVLSDKTPATEMGKNEAYARCNDVVQQQACDLARSLGERPILIAVVVPSDGPIARGGTQDAIRMWTERDRGEMVEVNPLASGS